MHKLRNDSDEPLLSTHWPRSVDLQIVFGVKVVEFTSSPPFRFNAFYFSALYFNASLEINRAENVTKGKISFL